MQFTFKLTCFSKPKVLEFCPKFCLMFPFLVPLPGFSGEYKGCGARLAGQHLPAWLKPLELKISSGFYCTLLVPHRAAWSGGRPGPRVVYSTGSLGPTTSPQQCLLKANKLLALIASPSLETWPRIILFAKQASGSPLKKPSTGPLFQPNLKHMLNFSMPVQGQLEDVIL